MNKRDFIKGVGLFSAVSVASTMDALQVAMSS